MQSIYYKYKITLILVLLTIAIYVPAQQTNTLYFLENAPMRHLVNPALQPISKGYLNFTPLGYMDVHVGNNSLTMSDLIYRDPTTGQTITALHPNGDKLKLLKQIKASTLLDGELSLNILSFGARVNEVGYFHVSIMERLETGVTAPKGLFDFLLGGGMQDLTGGTNTINLSQLGLGASLYTEVAMGYSHQLNEEWTIGGKLKVLLGQAYVGMKNHNLGIDASLEQWHLHGNSTLTISAPINYNALPKDLSQESLENMGNEEILDLNNWQSLITPAGYGAAIDFGFQWRPTPILQINAALTDLGFIYWTHGRSYNMAIDTTYNGLPEIEYDEYRNEDGSFNSEKLSGDMQDALSGLLDATNTTSEDKGFARMLSAKLNIGVDVNLWENRIGIGLLSQTRLFNSRLYEELTLGAALKPCNWFNIAVSYSLVNNGKFSNIGAGLSFMPYDGINLTLAMDYIPTTYAYYEPDETLSIPIPYKTKGFNLALGFSIVWGTNPRKTVVEYAAL